MEAQPFKIQRSTSWIGILVVAGYSILACILAKYLLPHKWHRFNFMGAFAVLAIYLIQQFYWFATFKKGVKYLKENNWQNAHEMFEKSYHQFQKNAVSDKLRFWLLISVSVYSGQAMCLLNMAFCQIMMKYKEHAMFYYKDLLQLPGGKEISLPLLRYFES